MTSSPLRPGVTLEEELDYYKKQYEQLETDLADFQASSKELEEQLERDIDNAEKSERKLKEQVEKLTFEVEEWKTKHKQSKTESNSAQNALQKEITTIRESNRAMQLKLRDIEVMNDDYERQARNTESSLEDMESKYNVAIERGVLLEEEMRTGEQERESLRIETQRLRDTLSELKVENEITLEKLRLADETIERLRSRKPSPWAVESLRARSPVSEASGATPSSPTASTPPPKSDTASDAQTPPSPPLSDAPANARPDFKTPMAIKRRSLIPDAGTTPRPTINGARTQLRHSRGPSVASTTSIVSDAKAMRPPSSRPRLVSRPSNLSSEGLPRSDSLYQIRNLRGRMQKIEERVQSARSKLPARTITPKGSPQTNVTSTTNLPSSITMRRSTKRPSYATASPQSSSIPEPNSTAPETPSRRQSYAKRPSLGIPRPTSVASDRPASALERPPSAASTGRPSSRLSLASNPMPAPTTTIRPTSRTGARTPQHDRTGSRASAYATIHGTPRTHRPSASVSDFKRFTTNNSESEDGNSSVTYSPTRGVGLGSMRRQSSGLPKFGTMKRGSIGVVNSLFELEKGGGSGGGSMMPPPPPPTGGLRRKMSDVGETY